MTAEMNAISVGDVVDHWLVRPSCLTSPLTARDQPQVGRVEHGLDPRAERAERVVALGPGELPVGALLVAGGDVVGARCSRRRARARPRGATLRAGRPMTTASSPS